MGPSVNRAFLIGYAGADPDVRTIASGRRVASLSVATTRRWTVPGGAREKTEWHRVVLWDDLAERAGREVRRGDRLFIAGRLEYRSWKDRSGRLRHATEISADELIPLTDDPAGEWPERAAGGATGEGA
jgi:single-strand DNA-binding protein